MYKYIILVQKGERMERLNLGTVHNANIIYNIGEKSVVNDYYELVYVNQGEIGVTLNERVFKLHSGMLVLYKPGEIHSIWWADENSKYTVVAFSCDSILLNDLESVTLVCEYQQILIQNLCELIETGSFDAKFTTTLELILLYANQKQIPETVSGDALLFTKALDIMRKNVSKQLLLESLADVLGISLSKLKRIFAKYSLIGVHEYFTELKVCYAKELLLQGNSVTVTAELAGFNNQNYFSSAFKRVTGKSPKEYLSSKKTTRVTRSYKTNTNKPKELPSYLL